MMDLKLLCCAVLFPIQIFLCVLKAAARLLMPQKRKDLGVDVVLITGGGRGIGRHLAKEFAKQGAKKVLKSAHRLQIGCFLEERAHAPSAGNSWWDQSFGEQKAERDLNLAF